MQTFHLDNWHSAQIIRLPFCRATFLKHPRTSCWYQPSVITTGQIEEQAISWLNDQSSLTQRLRQHCPGKFSVRVLSQQWLNANVDEARLLGISQRQRVLVRQVQLLCDRVVLVYARSLIPLKTLSGKHRRLGRLGNKPLGEYLFANSTLRRTQQQIALITDNDPLFDIARGGNKLKCNEIWGRRSLFKIDQKPLLVSEFFLPALFVKTK